MKFGVKLWSVLYRPSFGKQAFTWLRQIQQVLTFVTSSQKANGVQFAQMVRHRSNKI
jgi:hypothetical protein